jgi:hypothetical protein
MPDIVYAGQRISADLLTYRSPYVVGHATLTANSSDITSTTEVTILTTGSVTFTPGRAYKFEFHGLVQHTTTNLTALLYLRMRRTTGAALIRNFNDVAATNGSTSVRNAAVDVSTTVTPSTTITDSIYLTASWDTSATATFRVVATAGTPGLLTVSDVGPASDYPGIATFS